MDGFAICARSHSNRRNTDGDSAIKHMVICGEGEVRPTNSAPCMCVCVHCVCLFIAVVHFDILICCSYHVRRPHERLMRLNLLEHVRIDDFILFMKHFCLLSTTNWCNFFFLFLLLVFTIISYLYRTIYADLLCFLVGTDQRRSTNSPIDNPIGDMCAQIT